MLPTFVLEFVYGSEGRLYRTGDLSTDNLTNVGSSIYAGGDGWAHDDDDDSWDPNGQDHDQTRVSVVKFREDDDDSDNKEVRVL